MKRYERSRGSGGRLSSGVKNWHSYRDCHALCYLPATIQYYIAITIFCLCSRGNSVRPPGIVTLGRGVNVIHKTPQGVSRIGLDTCIA